MKFHPFPRLLGSLTVLALGVFSPNGHADWASLYGSNHSAPRPAPAPRPQPPRAPAPSHAPPPPAFHPAEPRPENRPVQERPPVIRTPAAEADRRRMDIDADRRQSFARSDFHRGMHVDRLPEGYRQIGVRGHPFFYFAGVFYDGGPAGYVVVDPPIDADIPELPPGAETVAAGGNVFYYADGAFYLQQGDAFVVVAAPLGVTVAELPPDAVSTVINGLVYYQADGVFYQPVIENGVTAYLTVPQPQ